MQQLWKRVASKDMSHRIGEWIQKVGHEGPRPTREWLYTFAVLLSRLHGWKNELKQSGGYTKDVVPFVRRLLVVVRHIPESDPLYHRLIGVTQCQ